MIYEKDFTYCPKCGKPFKRQEENLLVCTACDLHYYINPKSCNAVILENEKGEILFVKRKHDPQKGYWDLPGGFVDLDETIEASVHREMLEELQFDIDEFHYIGSMADTYEFKGIKYHTLCSLFLGKITKDIKLTPSDDAEECIFFAPDKIPYDMLAFESMKVGLKKYVEMVTK